MRLAFDTTRSTRRTETSTDASAPTPERAAEEEWFWQGPAARAEERGWLRALDEMPSDDDFVSPEPVREAAPAPTPDGPPAPPPPGPPPDLGGLELPSDDLLPGG